MFLVSQIKLIKRTKKIDLDLGIELGIGSLSTISTSRGVIESSKVSLSLSVNLIKANSNLF